MDPADSDAHSQDALRQALASQGALVGQHDTVLRDVVNTLQGLSASVSRLSSQVDLVSSLLSASAPTPPAVSPANPPAAPSVPAPPSREPFIPTPARYDGDLGACGRFLLQCNLVFQQQPATYHSDKSRVAFITSLLSGKASQWASALWERESPICNSFLDFVSEMRRVFDHPVQGKEAAKRLLSLRQGSLSVAEYAVEFRILAAESGWDEVALQGVFTHGLGDYIKDELAARDETDNLESLISLSIRLDNRLRERRREKAGRPQAPASRPLPRPPSRVSLDTPSVTAPLSPSPPAGTEEPMQLGRARLSPSERQRRMLAGLCIYCGQTGHFLATCSLRPKEEAHQ